MRELKTILYHIRKIEDNEDRETIYNVLSSIVDGGGADWINNGDFQTIRSTISFLYGQTYIVEEREKLRQLYAKY